MRRGRGRAGPGPRAGAAHDKANLLGLRGEAEAGRLQNSEAAARAKVGSLGAGGGGGGVAYRPVGRGGGGAPAGHGVAAPRSDRVAGAVSPLGDGVEFAQTGEQPATHHSPYERVAPIGQRSSSSPAQDSRANVTLSALSPFLLVSRMYQCLRLLLEQLK